MYVSFVNNNNDSCVCKFGFNFFVLFLGFLVPLFNRYYKYVFLMLIFSFFTFGFSNIIFAIIYNRAYIKFLLHNGFKPKTDLDFSILVEKGILDVNNLR